MDWKDIGFIDLVKAREFALKYKIGPSEIQKNSTHRFFTTDEGCIVAQLLDEPSGPVKEKCPDKPRKVKKAKKKQKKVRRRVVQPPWNSSHHSCLDAAKQEWTERLTAAGEKFEVLPSFTILNRGKYYLYVELDGNVVGKILS